MGNAESQEKLGERVVAARAKLEEEKKKLSERCEYFKANSPTTMNVMIASISQSFENNSPFLEPTLLIAWKADQNQCKKIVLNSCRKVLSSPIKTDEYEWFKQYVFPSMLWMFKTNGNRFMYQDLLEVTNNMSKDIMDTMNSIYEHLESHKRWSKIMAIENQTIISRQDDKRVNLLQERGIRDVAECKTNISDEKSQDINQTMQNFVDSNLAVNILTSTAKTINNEFQNHIKLVMSHYGDFKAGPMKKVERSLSKLENDYANEKFPKAAKLLDLIRCSVTFNTVDQLLAGYDGLINHIKKNKSIIELARVKNGFLDKSDEGGGYRDIKVNVVYKSQLNTGVNMICEIQLIFLAYLHEKKRIHKLYSIAREELYFKMVVSEPVVKTENKKDIKDLVFKTILNVRKDVNPGYKDTFMNRCSVDTELKILGLEGKQWFRCVDMKTKSVIFKQDTKHISYSRNTHHWFNKNGKKYLSLQTAHNIIKIFEVSDDCKFKEDESLRITLETTDGINFCEFDRTYDNILIVYNQQYLQKRAMNNVNKVLQRITLAEKLDDAAVKQLVVSDDGTVCSIAGGYGKPYIYLIDIPNNKQHKVKSDYLTQTYAPSFINGKNKLVAVGGEHQLEIFDIEKRKSFLKIPIKNAGYVSCSCSTNNILAIGSYDSKLRLFDVRSWEVFYTQQFELKPLSLHLTNDLKYLTVAGGDGKERCTVLQIQ